MTLAGKAGAVLALAVLVGAAVAEAQPAGRRGGQTPVFIPEETRLDPGDLGRVVMYRYAQCVIGNRPARAERYLATLPGSPEAEEAARRLATNACLDAGQMRFSEPLFRAGVYDVAYRMRFAKDGPVDFAAAPAIDYLAGRGPALSDEERHAVGVRHLADCTVRTAPATSRALLLSRVASRAEAAGFDALAPAMGECLRDGQLRFSKAMFRGMIGEALYRLSVQVREGGGDIR